MSHALHPAQIRILHTQAELPVVASLAVKFAVTVTKWDMRRKSRRALRDLDTSLLRDIGLDRPTAMAEANKPFWRD